MTIMKKRTGHAPFGAILYHKMKAVAVTGSTSPSSHQITAIKKVIVASNAYPL